jgi:hypothetical protein
MVEVSGLAPVPPSDPEISTWSACADQLRQVLDRVNIVMRRRRNQADAGSGMPDAGDPFVDLVSRQLAAFTRLGALCHLDLDIIGADQVFGGNAKTPRCNLLDPRTHRIAVLQDAETFGFFAAFTGIGASAKPVHRDRQRGMRFP